MKLFRSAASSRCSICLPAAEKTFDCDFQSCNLHLQHSCFSRQQWLEFLQEFLPQRKEKTKEVLTLWFNNYASFDYHLIRLFCSELQFSPHTLTGCCVLSTSCWPKAAASSCDFKCQDLRANYSSSPSQGLFIFPSVSWPPWQLQGIIYRQDLSPRPLCWSSTPSASFFSAVGRSLMFGPLSVVWLPGADCPVRRLSEATVMAAACCVLQIRAALSQQR